MNCHSVRKRLSAYLEFRHRHNRTLVNVLGIAVGIALFVSINATSTAYKKAVSRPFKNLGADLVVQRAEKRNMKGGRPATSMALALIVGCMTGYLLGRRTARMKPADILR